MNPFNFRALKLKTAAFVAAASLLSAGLMVVRGNGEHDAEAPAGAPSATIPVAVAERNIQNENGQFTLVLRRSPGDVRAGETEQFLVRITEKVEGGFGVNEPVPLEKASVAASITEADGSPIAENLAVTPEANGNYRASYTFGATGNFKVVFAVTTEDGRNLSADFPVTVTNTPVRSSFWLGLLILSFLTLGALGSAVYAVKRRRGTKFSYKQVLPFAACALVIFAISTIALAYFLPPRELRAAAEILPDATAETPRDPLTTESVLTVSKESQLLFGIRIEPVAVRTITSGLRTSGVVRARPDARAVVVPPVAGRIFLRQGLTVGSAVSRGEQIGYMEQVVDVAGQTGLETQRLEVEAKRLELRNTVSQLQSQQAEQRAKAQQARTQLAQAKRELTRAANLLEVGAVPRKRLEEAQTAVRVAEQEVVSADQQVRLLGDQIKQTQAGQAAFESGKVNWPSKIFPLTAPVGGIVNEVKATSGQVIETGSEVLSIVNLSTVLIEAQVFERDLPAVRESTRASFTSAALSGEVYTVGTGEGDGRLLSIGQTVNEQTRTVPIVYEMKNPSGRLRDGMFVEITIDTSGDRQVLAVPKAAVVTEQGQTFVFVFDGGETFVKRPVALGAEGADYFEVKSGLKEGERVVTEGIYQLRSAQPAT